MIIVILVIHVIICAGLIVLVLIQRGRGGGLVESFSGVESMFGTKTNTFLTRTTTVLSIMFFFTCLALAVLSARQSRSLMMGVKPQSSPVSKATPVVPKAEEKAAATQTQTPQKPAAQKTEGAPKSE
jgi:preprotein translocase subunit SecG